MKRTRFAYAAVMLLASMLAACGSSQPAPDVLEDSAVDVAADVASDTASDVITAPDAASDVAPAPDAAVDAASDVPADVSAPTDSSVGDGGIALCSAMLTSRASGCGAADVGLSTEICRCGSRYYWDGAQCASTAACRCTRNCDLLFDTQAACIAAYAGCVPDGGARD